MSDLWFTQSLRAAAVTTAASYDSLPQPCHRCLVDFLSAAAPVLYRMGLIQGDPQTDGLDRCEEGYSCGARSFEAIRRLERLRLGRKEGDWYLVR